MPVFSTNLNASNLTIPPTTTMEAHIAANNPHPNYLLVSDLKSAVNTQITVSELKDVVVGSSALQGTILQFKGAAYVPVTMNEALSGFELPIATEQSRGIIQLAVYNDIISKNRVKAVTPYLLDTYVSTRIAIEDNDIRNYIDSKIFNINVSVDSATTQRYGITKLATQADVVAKVASTVITPNLMVNYVNSVLSSGLPPEVIRATTIDYGIVRLAAEADTINPTEDPDAVVTVGNYADKINVGVVRLAQSNDIIAAVTSTAVTPDLVSTYVSAVHSTINTSIVNVSSSLETSITNVNTTLNTSIVNVSSALEASKQDRLFPLGLHTSVVSTVDGDKVDCLLKDGTNIVIDQATHKINCTLDTDSILNTFAEGMLKGLIDCTVKKQTYTKNSTKTACMGTYMDKGYIKFPFLKYTYTDPNNANIKKEYCLALIWGQHVSTYGKATNHYDTIEINIAGYYKLIRVIMPVLHYVGTAVYDTSYIPLNILQAATTGTAHDVLNTHDNWVHYVRANHVKNIGESVSDVDDYAPIESFTYYMNCDDETASGSYTITWFLLGLTSIEDDCWTAVEQSTPILYPMNFTAGTYYDANLIREITYKYRDNDSSTDYYSGDDVSYPVAYTINEPDANSNWVPTMNIALPVKYRDRFLRGVGDHPRSQLSVRYTFNRQVSYEDTYEYYIQNLAFVCQISKGTAFGIVFNELYITKDENGNLVIDPLRSDIVYIDNFDRYTQTYGDVIKYNINNSTLTKFVPGTALTYGDGSPDFTSWNLSEWGGAKNNPPTGAVIHWYYTDHDNYCHRLHFVMGYTDSQIIFQAVAASYYQHGSAEATRVLYSLPEAVIFQGLPKE